MKTGGSGLINKGGATIAVQRLHRIIGTGYEKAFSFKPLRLTADPKIKFAAKCLYDAVAFFAWQSSGPCTEPVEVVAALANVSRRQAIPAIQSLVDGGYLVRAKRGARQADSLTVVESGSIAAQSGDSSIKGTHRPKGLCKCGKTRPLSKWGICYPCGKTETMKRLYREAQAELPPDATHDEISVRVERNRASKKYLPIARKLRVA